MNYARRQQYRRLSRAGQSALASVTVALLAMLLLSIGFALPGGLLLALAVTIVSRARYWLSLAGRSGVGAHSEDEVRRALAPLEQHGWRLRHALRWQGGGDIDSVAIAPNGVGFAIETKTRRYDERQLGRVLEQASWLVRRRRRWCRGGALPVLCVVRAAGVARYERGVLVVSLDRLVPVLREVANGAELGAFIGWLRHPGENVIVLSEGAWRRSPRSVNRALGAVHGFYEYHARNGVMVAERLVARSRVGSGSYKPFLHGIARSVPHGRVLRVREEQRRARTLTAAQVQAVLNAQRWLRDRCLFALLFSTGMRIGQALGLRHEDFVGHERRVEIVPREGNANRARGKNSRGSVPVTTELVRRYSDYMHEEYGELDSDYVFVNLWGGRIGRPLTYASVDDLVRRTRASVGFHFTAHTFRHTYASMARAGGVPLEVVSKLLTHKLGPDNLGDLYAHDG